MFYLFEQINTYYENQFANNSRQNRQNDQTLLNLEKNINNIENEINLKIIYFTQLSYLFEYIDPKLIIDKQTLQNQLQLIHRLKDNKVSLSNQVQAFRKRYIERLKVNPQFEMIYIAQYYEPGFGSTLNLMLQTFQFNFNR
jgi:hypothetical protein